MSIPILSELREWLTFWKREAREERKDQREQRDSERDETRLDAERREAAIQATQRLRDNLRERVEREGDPTTRENLQAQLTVTDDVLTNVLRDVALSDPRFRYYYAEALRALVPRQVGPQPPVPEPVRETAVLVERVGQAAGLTPQDAEGHFLRGNALQFESRFQDAVSAYDQALTFYAQETFSKNWAVIHNNKGVALRRLGERLVGEEGMASLRDAIAAYDRALAVFTREALPQDWATTQNNRGVALGSLGERLAGESAVAALREAIAAFESVLEVYTAEHFAYHYALVQQNRERARRLLEERGGG